MKGDSKQTIPLDPDDIRDVQEIRRAREEAEILGRLAGAKREIVLLREQLLHDRLRAKHGFSGQLTMTVDADRRVLIIDQASDGGTDDNP